MPISEMRRFYELRSDCSIVIQTGKESYLRSGLSISDWWCLCSNSRAAFLKSRLGRPLPLFPILPVDAMEYDKSK